MKKKKIQNQKVHTDRYLITYADLLTLLLGLFAILFATSQVDLAKYREVAAAMSNIFNPVENPDKNAKTIVQPNSNSASLPPPIIMANREKSIGIVKNETQSELKNLIKDGKINFTSTANGFKIILDEKLLFLPGQAAIQKNGIEVLDTLAKVLKNINKQINVDGHADASPLRSLRYESNWHLSSARAAAVAYQLINNGVGEYNIAIRAFGSQRPIANNSTEEGKEKNRRVEIVVTDKDDSAAAVTSVENKNDSLNR